MNANTAYFPSVQATCISCGCTDDQACAGGCSWLRVNYEFGVGVCSECPEAEAGFDEHFATEPRETTIPNQLLRSLAS